MGFLDKMKSGMTGMAPPAPAGHVGVQGAGMINAAVMGGPSTTALAVDDPLLQPINGVDLHNYARILKAATNLGITDEAGICAFVAANHGIATADFAAAIAGWNERMKQSMIVGQQFNRVYTAS